MQQEKFTLDMLDRAERLYVVITHDDNRWLRMIKTWTLGQMAQAEESVVLELLKDRLVTIEITDNGRAVKKITDTVLERVEEHARYELRERGYTGGLE